VYVAAYAHRKLSAGLCPPPSGDFSTFPVVSDPAEDAVAFDEWEHSGDDWDVPYSEDDDEFEGWEDGGAWIAEHNAVQRLVLAHEAYEHRGDAVEASVAARGAGTRISREAVTLPPRLAGDRAARHGEILQQRARTTVSTFSSDDELRVFLAEQTNWDWFELVRPTPAGRPTAAVREQRAELARLVVLARAQGAGYEMLARVLSRSLATVHTLAP
jgi:hypothetical protein